MQILKSLFIAILSTLIAIIIFMPTKQLYFLFEEELAKNGIKLNEDKIQSGIFGLDIDGIDVYVEGIKVAHIEHIHFTTFLLVSDIDVKSVVFDKSLSKVLPSDISEIDLKHNIISPTTVNIEVKGDFGLAKGYVGVNHTLHLDFVEVKDISMFKNELQKGDNGWYYETKF
jgi:hypothetical protein